MAFKLIRSVVKTFSVMILVTTIIWVAFLGGLSYYIVVPSLNGTDISMTDLLLKREIDPEGYKLLENKINDRASFLGNKAARSFASMFGINGGAK